MASVISPRAEISPKGKIGDNCKIFPFGLISALGLITLAILLYYQLSVIYFPLIRSSTKSLIEIDDSLHLCKVVGHLGDLGIEQTALCLNHLQISSIGRT